MKARLHLKVYGIVQGVFFRANTRQKARDLGLSGWVKNTSDGAVECVAEGERQALEALSEWCKSGGPPGASVQRFVEEWGEHTGEFSSFEIAY